MSAAPDQERDKPISDASSTTWAITAYFNPVGYRRRLLNYRFFRKHLPLPLLAAEFGWQGRFDLCSDDAEVLIQADGPDVLWQRERLLNLAMISLPDHVTKVVWFDCDAVFEDADWVGQMEQTLDEYPIAQAFTEVVFLPETRQPQWRQEFRELEGRPSLCSLLSTRRDLRSVCVDLPRQSNRVFPGPTGFGWAFRREAMEPFGFYDVCVLGGADLLLVSALAGCFERGVDYHKMTDAAKDHFMAWAEPVHERFSMQVGCVPARVYHLWHGAVGDRGYQSRYERFARFQFDPSTDLRHRATGAWEWGSEKPRLHQFVEDYFAKRKEDG